MIRHQRPDTGSSLVPAGTLRGHRATISAFNYFYLPSNVSYTTHADRAVPILIPTVVTADEQGDIIWWDLNIKRPIAVWKGHESTVLTVKQLGVEWQLDELLQQEIPLLDFAHYGKVLTHSKDGTIKIWSLFEVLDLQNLTYKYSKLFSRQLPSIGSETASISPDFHEIPVNSLNYCNVDVFHDRLITPSTINSNNFDIYVLPSEGKPLERIFKDVDLYKVVNPLEEVNNDQRDFGIIMRVMFLNDKDRICLGYESGEVIVVSLSEFEIDVLAVNSDAHRPNPILAMTFDKRRQQVVTTSANDRVLFMDAAGDCKVQLIKHHGICSLSWRADSMLGLVTWDGFTRVYGGDGFDLKFKINKLTPSVKVNDLNIEDKDKVNVKIRLVLLEFSKRQANYQQLKQDKALKYNNGTSKMIVRRREESQYDKNWLCVAFNDGRVIFYDIS